MPTRIEKLAIQGKSVCSLTRISVNKRLCSLLDCCVYQGNCLTLSLHSGTRPWGLWSFAR